VPKWAVRSAGGWAARSAERWVLHWVGEKAYLTAAWWAIPSADRKVCCLADDSAGSWAARMAKKSAATLAP
jgi:hypothetical protein